MEKRLGYGINITKHLPDFTFSTPNTVLLGPVAAKNQVYYEVLK